ncbi:MAG: type II secretion system protein GspH [Zetaproteobacteria bacterium CG1_02_53_45]|nr:MAG: type II secretion system protein GspH [Zetaproteobacteria bacterium CG1_02_53_45]
MCLKPATAPGAESGFTLLEMLLVVVILAVSATMIAPSYFSAASASLEDEGGRLVQVLRLASEECVLSGRLLRVLVRAHSYEFQVAGADGKWQAVEDQMYREHQLYEGFKVAEIRPQLALTEEIDTQQIDTKEKDAEVVISQLLLPPDGIRQIADIVLAEESANGRQITVQFRPGPGGIRIVTETL